MGQREAYVRHGPVDSRARSAFMCGYVARQMSDPGPAAVGVAGPVELFENFLLVGPRDTRARSATSIRISSSSKWATISTGEASPVCWTTFR